MTLQHFSPSGNGKSNAASSALKRRYFSMRDAFRICAQRIATACGSPLAFTLAILGVLIWAATGPLFHYSDSWQLVINTSTTVVTFLMVFLIQNSQNRDTKAIQLKLDELLRGVKGARTSLVNLESMTDEELDNLRKEFEKLRLRSQMPRATADAVIK